MIQSRILTDRLGLRLVPSKIDVSSSTVTWKTAIGDYSSATASSNAVTHVFKRPSMQLPFVFGTSGTTSAGGLPQFSSIGKAGFVATSTQSDASTAAANEMNLLAAAFSSGITLSFGMTQQPVYATMPYLVEPFAVQGTSTAAITLGKSRATLTDNGTGDYTITLKNPCKNTTPICFAGVLGTSAYVADIHAVTASTIQVKTYNGSSAVDADFCLFVFSPQSHNIRAHDYSILNAAFRRPRLHLIQVDVSGGTPALTYAPEGTTIEDTGTGVFTITFGMAFKQAPYVLPCYPAGKSAVTRTKTGLVLRTFNGAGSAADPTTPVYVLVLGTDSNQEVV